MIKILKGEIRYERPLHETERILATHKDVVVPVKEIWLEVSKQGQLQRFEVPPLVDFTALLEGDERFEFLPAGDELGDGYVEPMEDDEIEYAADMERLGFYSEDRVRLRNIDVTEELEEEASGETDEPASKKERDESESEAKTVASPKTKNKIALGRKGLPKSQKISRGNGKAPKSHTKSSSRSKKKVKSKK